MILGHAEINGQSGHEAGRALLQSLYRQYVGAPLPPIVMSHRGKPYFKDSPVHFSISHTKHHVFCALSREPVGIDAEELTRDIRLELKDKILSPSELAQYNDAPDKRLALLTFWVLKEAQAKCTGLGLQGYPRSTAFCLTDPRVQQSHGCLLAVIEKTEQE